MGTHFFFKGGRLPQKLRHVAELFHLRGGTPLATVGPGVCADYWAYTGRQKAGPFVGGGVRGG